MRKMMKLGVLCCTLMLALVLASFTEKPLEDPTLEGTWIEVFYEFNFDAGKVESMKYNFNAMLSNQEKWIYTAQGENQYNLKTSYFHRGEGFVEDGDFDIKVVNGMYITEFDSNFKVVELTADKLVVECYNDTTLKERKTFKRSK